MSLVPTGIDGLDDILGGGLPVGHLYLVEGNSGTGKTTLGLQFLLESHRRGERVLYITLSETDEDLRSAAASHGWKTDGLEVFELNAAQQTALGADVSLFHPGEVELGEAMRTLLDEVTRQNAQCVVFDSLSEIRMLAHQPLRYRRQVLALKQHFAKRGCTVLLLDDRTALPHDAQLLSIAHGVLLLEEHAPAYGVERRRLRVMKLRGRRYRGGYHDYVIATGGLKVFPRLVASEHREPAVGGRVSSGSLEFDALLHGGLTRGTSTLVMGPAGSGKSSLVTTFTAAAAARGERGMSYLFDETIGSYMKRAESLGLDIRTPIEDGRLGIQQVDPAELSPGEFGHQVRTAVENGASFIVIDSLSGYLHSMPDEQYLVIQLHELLTYLAQRGVLTFMVMPQAGLLGPAMKSSVDVSYLADTVVLMRYFEAAGAVRNALSVLKQRTGAHEKTIREYAFSSNGLRIGPPLAQFQAFLTGVPQFLGESTALLTTEESENEAAHAS